MKKNILIVVIIIAVVALGVAIYFSLPKTSGTGTENENTPSNNQGTYVPSEKSDTAKFDEYFKSIYLGKLKIGEQPGAGVVPQVSLVFTKGKDQYCTVLELKKALAAGAYSSAIYNLDSKTYIKPKTSFPGKFELGTNVGCGSLPAGAGRYEYKAYLGNTLITVVPFEIKDTAAQAPATPASNAAANSAAKTTGSPVLEFTAGGCDQSIDPYTEPYEAITGKSWAANAFLVSAYVKTLCDGINISGNYALSGSNLALKINMTHSGPQGECYCARKLTYKISNLEQRDYQVSIIRGE